MLGPVMVRDQAPRLSEEVVDDDFSQTAKEEVAVRVRPPVWDLCNADLALANLLEQRRSKTYLWICQHQYATFAVDS